MCVWSRVGLWKIGATNLSFMFLRIPIYRLRNPYSKIISHMAEDPSSSSSRDWAGSQCHNLYSKKIMHLPEVYFLLSFKVSSRLIHPSSQKISPSLEASITHKMTGMHHSKRAIIHIIWPWKDPWFMQSIAKM